MKTQKHLFIFLIIMIVLNACSIEKKHASFGYHIEWRNNKFTDGNKTIAQKSKLKVAKEKAVITLNEKDLILDIKSNSKSTNQESKTEILIDSNENLKYNLQDKTRIINIKQLSIIEKSYDLVSKKIPLPKQSKLEMPYFILWACIALGLSLLFLLIAFLAPSYEDLALFGLLSFLLFFLCIALIAFYLLELLLKSIKKKYRKKDANQFNHLKPKSH
jgi:hypothetical protein